MSNRWYPSIDQMKDPETSMRMMKQVLDLHYALEDKVTAMQSPKKGSVAPTKGAPPPGCGPADTQILGLRVAPVDVSTLADGTRLTWVKAQGHFEVK